MNKITIIGSGSVGSTIANDLMIQGTASEIVLIDVNKQKAFGEAMDQVQMVVEGVYSAKAGRALAEKYQITMPIIEQVNQVLFEDKPAAQAVGQLMTRDRTQEHFSLPWD